jgi:hypothetical protein
MIRIAFLAEIPHVASVAACASCRRYACIALGRDSGAAWDAEDVVGVHIVATLAGVAVAAGVSIRAVLAESATEANRAGGACSGIVALRAVT